MQHIYGSEEGKSLFDRNIFALGRRIVRRLLWLVFGACAETNRIGDMPIERSIAVCTGWDLAFRIRLLFGSFRLLAGNFD